eukprot:6187062-Amphidinium_carterae.2
MLSHRLHGMRSTVSWSRHASEGSLFWCRCGAAQSRAEQALIAKCLRGFLMLTADESSQLVEAKSPVCVQHHLWSQRGVCCRFDKLLFQGVAQMVS